MSEKAKLVCAMATAHTCVFAYVAPGQHVCIAETIARNTQALMQSSAIEITALRAALARERADNESLRAFAQEMAEVRNDSFDVFESMCKHALIAGVSREKPCGEECYCRDEYGEYSFPLDCYKPTALLSGRGEGE